MFAIILLTTARSFALCETTRSIAKLWSITVTATRERCHHYTATRLKNFQADSTYIKAADIRKAEAKVEMLKAR